MSVIIRRLPYPETNKKRVHDSNYVTVIQRVEQLTFRLVRMRSFVGDGFWCLLFGYWLLLC